MEWYPWLNGPYRQLIEGCQEGRAHHAVLLHALPGMGRESLVYSLSRRLLCQTPEGMKSCGECHSCKLMMAGTHPDWYALSPEKGKQTLGVDAIRSVLENLYQRSRQGGAKLVWIENSEQLTEAAANALLKTLEEPPEATYFLLGCYEPTRLLATLRSRCLYLYLPTPDEAQSVVWLNKRHPASTQVLQTALRLQAGAPLAAEHFLQEETARQRTALCQALANAVAPRAFYTLLPLLNHEDSPERIHWLSSLLLDALKIQRGAANARVNLDQDELVTLLANRLTAAELDAVLSRWLCCRHQLLTVTGVNRELLLADVLLEWEQLFQTESLNTLPPFSV
ncbi:MAG: DNA polymerase III subunit delta' [Symbiopectobacterium sp.]|uniref:DNA polymerase III subunit delta' n=1 Tax=Symbiopectobacterium sp. TaxID=2952789 RepID=UPI0039ED1B88